MSDIPNKLRLIDGQLVCADGSDVREYLRLWAERLNVTADTPVNLVRHDGFKQERELATMMRHWAS